MAIFIDFENLALGFQGRRERFDIARVLERLVEKGKIVAKKAYADWHRFSQFTHALHEAAIELIEIPRRAQSGKNSADIRLCVDAMDLAYSKEHINTFAIVSGDSDFSPLVSKLKELGKHVIGLGMQESTSDLLRDNCDEFIYYEDLGQPTGLTVNVTSHIPDQKRKAFELLLESLAALRRENKEVLWSSMIKDTIKRKKPSFNETYHGYRTFSELLEDAQQEGLLELDTDKRSRTYVVTRFGPEMNELPAAPAENGESADSASLPEPGPATNIPMASPDGMPLLPARKRSRRRRRRGQGGGLPALPGNGSPGTGIPSMAGPALQPAAIPDSPSIKAGKDSREKSESPDLPFGHGLDLEQDDSSNNISPPPSKPSSEKKPEKEAESKAEDQASEVRPRTRAKTSKRATSTSTEKKAPRSSRSRKSETSSGDE
ncbi:MAG: NYN domain-containing protein [Gemmataceae bacterium]